MSSTTSLVNAIDILDEVEENRNGNFELSKDQMIRLQRYMLRASTSNNLALLGTHEQDQLIKEARK